MISSRPDALAIEKAKKGDIPIFVLQNFADKQAVNRSLKEHLEELSPDLIILAGYMRLLPPDIVLNFRGKIMNIHPSLLPAFSGLSPQKQAIDHGVKVSGCTVHFVDEGLDSGPIILQKAVEIEEGMTSEKLAEKILPLEHQILTKAVDLFCRGKLKVEGRRVRNS